MEKCLVEPLADAYKQGARRKHIILIDGFDECLIMERGHLLQVLHTLVTSIPLHHIIVASRPELDMQMAFISSHLAAVTHFLRLQDYDGTFDIRNYFCDEFCRIREVHPARKCTIPLAWPVEEVLDTLVEESSGNFIGCFPVSVWRI
ncbi:hypothetical protein FA13DRAFT_45120 [Coprinellus micaceus]|uniref:NACHT domain-containing protein n=1 Tax=Coprinellus micaceus TaxID=71717 RepID=A0A4Y7U2F9_COPMI|nr:hypothetical protein FA13DRAFT_45120 [Coprinellus micaceus]